MPALVTDLNGAEGQPISVVDNYSVLPKENVGISIGMHFFSFVFSLVVLVILIKVSARIPEKDSRLMSWLIFFVALTMVAGFAGAVTLLMNESSAVAC